MEGGLGLGGSVHEEAHPCFPCFIQSFFKSIDAGSIYCPLVQLIPSINHSIRKKYSQQFRVHRNLTGFLECPLIATVCPMLGSWKPERGRTAGSERVRVSSGSGLLVTYVPVAGRFHYVGGTSYVDSKFAVSIHHLHGPSAKPLGLCGLGEFFYKYPT